MTEEELHNLVNESIHSLIEKKLCPKGKAYYNRRRAAGEVPSAYLSGRAVKVCKGLMEGDEDMITCDNCGWEWDLEDGGKEPFLCHKCGNDNSDKYTSMQEDELSESLRDWFKKEDWVRIDTQGNITGPCGTMKKGQATTRCLPRAKANSLSKAERAATSRKKAAADRKGDRVVPNTDKAKVRLEAINPLGWEKYIKSESEEIERTALDLGLPYDVTYNAFVNGDEVTLTDEMWSRLENTDSYDINSEEEAIELARHYGKDIQSILSAEKTPPALILQYSPNKYYLVGGNTRLMVARAKGINPQVILGTIEPLNKYAYQDVNDIGADLNEDCGCNGPKLVLKEIKNLPILSEGILHHIKEGLPLIHNIFRPLSKKYFELFREARELYNKGLISVSEDDIELMESSIGEIGIFEGINVPLDYPLSEEELITEAEKAGKKVAIGKPKRGGSKKFYVYVRKPGGGIKKVSFGDTTGLRAKLNNPQSRRAFAARHDCKNKKDRTKASYWSCRLPRYAKLLGFKTTFSGFW
jgi:hypothetical protein